MMDEAYPHQQACSAAADGLLRSRNARRDPVLVQLSAELGQYHVYHGYLQGVHRQERQREKLVKVGKNIGIIFAILTTIVGPMIYFFSGRSQNLPGLSRNADCTAGF